MEGPMPGVQCATDWKGSEAAGGEICVLQVLSIDWLQEVGLRMHNMYHSALPRMRPRAAKYRTWSCYYCTA